MLSPDSLLLGTGGCLRLVKVPLVVTRAPVSCLNGLNIVVTCFTCLDGVQLIGDWCEVIMVKLMMV